MVTDAQKEKVWQKAKEISGNDPAKYRHDPYFNLLYRDPRGNIHDLGWEVGCLEPKSSGDTIRDLQALDKIIKTPPKGDSLIKRSIKRKRG